MFFVLFRVHVCVHVCVYLHECRYMCMNSKARKVCGTSSFAALCLTVLRQGLALKLILAVRPACQQAIVYPPVSMTRGCGYRSMQSCLGFSHGCWGFKLRSSGLFSKRSYPLGHLSSSSNRVLNSSAYCGNLVEFLEVNRTGV